jgi:6-phosphogluconolactonase (cycloisomerase 2 family)
MIVSEVKLFSRRVIQKIYCSTFLNKAMAEAYLMSPQGRFFVASNRGNESLLEYDTQFEIDG